MMNNTQQMSHDIYITGAGVFSAIGTNKAETLDAIMNQQSGVKPVKYLQTSHPEFIVGEVKFSNDELREMLNIPASEAFIRSSLIGIPAVDEALKQAQLISKQLSEESWYSTQTTAYAIVAMSKFAGLTKADKSRMAAGRIMDQANARMMMARP